MNPNLAIFVDIVGVAGLLYLDRDKTLRMSKALWIPTIWLLIIGSRPVSVWLGISPVHVTTEQAAEGSPFDAALFGILLLIGIGVLVSRRKKVAFHLKMNWPCVVYFSYCLLSVLWSDFPEIAIKRWGKAIGDLVMVLVIVTETEPVQALGKLISRVGLFLMPASVIMIRYLGDLGRSYDPEGSPMNTGVTTNKNELGVIAMVISLGAVWRFLEVLLSKRQPNRMRKLIARGALVVFSVAVLDLAHSATSIACFLLGTTIIVAAHFPVFGRRPRVVHALVASLLALGGIIILFGGQGDIVHALGRQTDLTGRTQIWAAVLPVVPNPIVGAGFESFWLGPRLDQVYANLSQYMHVNEAHNGYIEMYLNLGWIGIVLIATILISGYKGAVMAIRRNPRFGGLMLAYIATSAIYSISEAGFRMLDPMWVFLLIGVAGSYSVAFSKAKAIVPGRPLTLSSTLGTGMTVDNTVQ